MALIGVIVDVDTKSPFQQRKQKNTNLMKKTVKFTNEFIGSEILPIENDNDDLKVLDNDDTLQGSLSSKCVNEILSK